MNLEKCEYPVNGLGKAGTKTVPKGLVIDLSWTQDFVP